MVSYGFFELINTLGVAVTTSHHWPLGDEGKQAKLFRGVSGPPPYPAVQIIAIKPQSLEAIKVFPGGRDVDLR